MKRRALLVGVASHTRFPELHWCANDAIAMRQALQYHANGEPNFDCRLLLGVTPDATDASMPAPARNVEYGVTFNGLRKALEDLFAFDDMVLLYFAGHGYPSDRGRYLVTQDGTSALPGILMNDVLEMANRSPAREVVVIIDSCFAGGVGEPEQAQSATWEVPNLYLREGVTVLAATRPNQRALEMDGGGVFTRLLLGALYGGAADVRGWVSAAALYAYIEQALGPWEQRPVYKSNASQLSPIRYCAPDIEDADLRLLPRLFPTPTHQYTMDPTFEVTRLDANPENVKIFRLFKRYQVARLLRPSFAFDNDLYFVAIRSHSVELTPLGQFYWSLASENRLSGAPTERGATPLPTRTLALSPDPASIAQMFHEAYERLALNYGYETRRATAAPWSDVPEQNKRLMIAVATEVMAALYPLPPSGGADGEER